MCMKRRRHRTWRIVRLDPIVLADIPNERALSRWYGLAPARRDFWYIVTVMKLRSSLNMRSRLCAFGLTRHFKIVQLWPTMETPHEFFTNS